MTIALPVPFLGGLNWSPAGAGAGEFAGRICKSGDAARRRSKGKVIAGFTKA